MDNQNTVTEMEEKIREGFAAVVRPELYPDFLAFAGRFPGFGADNLLLAFRQRPGAAALAGRYVWIRLTGVDASPRGEPVSVFYPGYDPDHRRINPVVVSLYDIRQATGAEVQRQPWPILLTVLLKRSPGKPEA